MEHLERVEHLKSNLQSQTLLRERSRFKFQKSLQKSKINLPFSAIYTEHLYANENLSKY